MSEQEIDWKLVAEEFKSRLVLVISAYEEQFALMLAKDRQRQQMENEANKNQQQQDGVNFG